MQRFWVVSDLFYLQTKENTITFLSIFHDNPKYLLILYLTFYALAVVRLGASQSQDRGRLLVQVYTTPPAALTALSFRTSGARRTFAAFNIVRVLLTCRLVILGDSLFAFIVNEELEQKTVQRRVNVVAVMRQSIYVACMLYKVPFKA